MLRIDPRRQAGFLILAVLALGCGETSPRSSNGRPVVVKPDLKLTPAHSIDSDKVPRLAMILPRETTLSTSVWEQSARRAAGRSQATFEVYRPSGSDLIQHGGQADLIRLAVRSGASALIVAPEDPQELGPALVESRAQGVPAVSILQAIPVDTGEPIPVIVRSPAKDVAETLVRAAQEDAQAVGYSSGGPALLLVNESAVDAEERAEALAEAAKAADLNLFGGGPIRFQGDTEVARERIQAAREQEPRLAIVLVTDDVGFRAATSLRDTLEPDDRFVMAGYIGDRRNMNMVGSSFASAAAEYNDIDIGVLAAKTALRLHHGEELPDKVLAEPRVQRAPGPPSRGGL